MTPRQMTLILTFILKLAFSECVATGAWCFTKTFYSFLVLNPGVKNRPVITHAHLSEVDLVRLISIQKGVNTMSTGETDEKMKLSALYIQPPEFK